jgi:hypothetical protein
MSDSNPPREYADYFKLSDSEKDRMNRDLIRSGGVLHDYDHNELMFPLKNTLEDILGEMLRVNKDNLNQTK